MQAGGLGLHLLDIDDARICVQVGDIERDEGVLHPEGPDLFVLEHEDHPGAVREIVAVLEPLAALIRRAREPRLERPHGPVVKLTYLMAF